MAVAPTSCAATATLPVALSLARRMSPASRVLHFVTQVPRVFAVHDGKEKVESAPGATVFKEHGFTVDHVVDQALALVGKRPERG